MAKDVVIIRGKGASRDWHKAYMEANKSRGVELWTLNDDILPATNSHFDIHSGAHHQAHIAALWGNGAGRIACYINPNRKKAFPWQKHYPIGDVISQVGRFSCFRSTISYMIALAVLQGFKKICLPGCDFNDPNEDRTSQRQCAERWLYFAIGRGVEVDWPLSNSKLFDNLQLANYE